MKSCTVCMAPSSDEAVKCSSCGETLPLSDWEAASGQGLPTAKKEGGIPLSLFLIVVLALAASAGYLYWIKHLAASDSTAASPSPSDQSFACFSSCKERCGKLWLGQSCAPQSQWMRDCMAPCSKTQLATALPQ